MLMTRIIHLILCLAIISVPSFASIRLSYGEDIEEGWGDAGAVLTPYVAFSNDLLKPYNGNYIESIQIGLCKEASNCYLYIKRNPSDPEPVYKQKIGDLTAGWNEIKLDSPFEITAGQNIAIGYKASFREAGGVGISDEIFPNAQAVFYNSRNQWVSVPGSICLTASVNGDKLPEDYLTISQLYEEKSSGTPEGVHKYKGYVRNRGNNCVDNYKIDVQLDGKSLMTVEGKTVPLGGRSDFSFEIAEALPGKHQVVASIIEVNDTEVRDTPDNSASASFVVKSDLFIQKVVCEEYTGTWCGLCPSGIVALEIMKEAYPDTFFPVCIHGNDPMEITDDPDQDYEKFINSCRGAPECNLNRKLKGDPYTDIQGFYNLETSGECHYIIDAVSNWDETYTGIIVKSTFMSDLDLPSQKLNIAYTIIESGITGYPQTNYYADGRNGDFYGWGNKSELTYDVVFNDVARAIVGGYDGIPCHSGAIESMAEYTHEYTLRLPPNVMSRDNIAIVVQLIEPGSGYILNACRIVPQAPQTGAVREVIQEDYFLVARNADNAKINVYDLFGRLVLSDDRASGKQLSLPAGWYVVTIVTDSEVIKRFKIHISE